MERWIIGFAALAASLGAAAAAQDLPSRTVRAGEPMEWSAEEQPDGIRYQSGPFTLTFTNTPQRESPDLSQPLLQVELDGHRLATVRGELASDYVRHRATVGRWSADGTPYVFFESFSGGAHCCNRMQAIVPQNGELAVYDLGSWDGAFVHEVPKDEDGDGAVDFVQRDNAFLYAFASYADSFAPPLVLNVVDGQVDDVSTRPGFRPLFEEAAGDARRICTGGEGFRNGACASYVAASTRLGRFEEAWAEMLRNYERGEDWPRPQTCRVTPGDEGCPENQLVTHADYPSALRAFLVEQGYIER